MKNTTIIMILLCVVFGAGGFFAGMKYRGGQTSGGGQFVGRFNGQAGAGRTGGEGTRTGLRPISGDIISADNNSITVKLADGSSSIVLLTSKTTINKEATASSADLTTGVRVSAFGTANTDGSMTATNVQINPMGGGFGGPRETTTSPTP
jgi:hypothetical protein